VYADGAYGKTQKIMLSDNRITEIRNNGYGLYVDDNSATDHYVDTVTASANTFSTREYNNTSDTAIRGVFVNSDFAGAGKTTLTLNGNVFFGFPVGQLMVVGANAILVDKGTVSIP
jgi:hypothetical protein